MARTQIRVIAILFILVLGVWALFWALAVGGVNLPLLGNGTTAEQSATDTPGLGSSDLDAALRETPVSAPDLGASLPSALPSPTSNNIPCMGWSMPHPFSFFQDSSGRTHFVGEARNASSETKRRVTVVVKLFNASAQYVGYTSAPLLLDSVPPGQSSPFNVVLGANGPGWQSYSISFECSPPSAFPEVPYTNLQITSKTTRADKTAPYAIGGEVKNTGKSKAHAVQVIAVLYDANGWVINAAAANSQTPDLAPGAAAPFQIAFDTLPHPVADYNLYVQARPVE